MLYLILLLIIICCLGVIFFVARNKFDRLEGMGKSTEPKEKLDEIKKKLIENKLQKKLINAKDKLQSGFRSGIGIFGRGISKIKFYKKSKPTKLEKKRKIESASESKGELLEAQVLLRQRKLEEAEKKFISALKNDIKNLDAYMGLGEVYAAKKDWQTAIETYKYIIKINAKYLLAYKELINILSISKNWGEIKEFARKIFDLGFKEAWIYAGLGLSYRKTGYPEKAEEWYEKAVAAEPNSERYLDCLLEVSIMNKNKNLAYKTFNTLSEISRDALKMQDYRNKIEIL